MPERRLLAGRHDLAFVRRHLLPAATWRRFPAAGDRPAWQALPAATREAWIARGAARAAEPWEHLTATRMLDFVRRGDRRSFQDPHFRRRTRLHDLVLAECAEGAGRFLDAIADQVWLTCEESYWGWPAHLSLQQAGPGLVDPDEPTVDLGVGESAALLAWTDHLLGAQLDGISPQLRRRLRREVDHRLLKPCLERDDFWWMGWHIGGHTVNNWNPWVNSNWLACALILEADADRRAAAVHKILRSLDVFMDHQHADGGCDEGPNYWGRAAASLYDCLELLHHASGGVISIFDEPLIGELARFMPRTHVAGDWFVNFADGAARPNTEGALLARFARHLGDPGLEDFGHWLKARRQPSSETVQILTISRTLAAAFAPPAHRRAPAPPLLRDVWLPDLQVAVARDAAGSERGFIFAAKGGHNDESHNHNDLGSFIVYLDGEPLLIDVGVEVYTAKTFSPQRYEIWTMQSAWHNLPTINGVEQAPGRDFAAHAVRHTADDRAATFSLDLAAAYPAAAGVRRWTRTLVLERGRALRLTDDYELDAPRTPAVFHFITAAPPEPAAGAIRFRTPAGAAAELAYDAAAFDAEFESRAIDDPNLVAVWGEAVHRVRLTERAAAARATRNFTLRRAPA